LTSLFNMLTGVVTLGAAVSVPDEQLIAGASPCRL
jgi:hypothetical protein